MNDARLRATALLGGVWLCAGFAWPNAGGMAGAARAAWVLALVGAALLAWRRGVGGTWPRGQVERDAGFAQPLAWTCLLALLLSSGAQLLVALPRLAWCVLGLGGLWLWPRPASRRRGRELALAALVLMATLALAWAGDQHAAAAPNAYASVRSGLVLGANPRQSFALEYAPGRTIQVVLDDYVDPREPGVDPATLPPEAQPKGDSVPDYATRLETSLRAAAPVLEPRELPGTAAGHAALAGMRVELVPAASPAPQEAAPDGGSPAVKRGHGLRIRSGARGNGRLLRVVCPGRLLGRVPVEPQRGCPRKYAAQANAGLGLSARWPGYSEHPGQARVGFQAVAVRLGVRRRWRPGVGLLLWALVWIAALVAAGRATARDAQADARARFFLGAVTAVGVCALVLAVCGALEFAPSSLLALVGGEQGPASGPLRWDADAWRWPLGIVTLSALWSAKTPGAPAEQVGGTRASPGTLLWVSVAVGIATTAWISHGGDLGEQSIAVRESLLSWIDIGADAAARHTALPFELGRALLASVSLLVIAGAALALNPWSSEGSALDASSPRQGALRVTGLLAMVWLCARKPAWFDALLACAWLSFEIQRWRGAVARGSAHAGVRDPKRDPGAEKAT